MRSETPIILAATRLALASTLLAGCAAHQPTPPKGEPIVIGAVYNLTGSQSVLDLPSAHGAQLAVDDHNARGGILGRPIRLVTVDARTQPDATAGVTARLLADHPDAVAVIGLSDTDFVLAAAPIAAGQGRVFLTSGATSPKLPDEVPEYLFLACFGDNVQAAVAAEWMHEDLGVRTVAIVYQDDHEYTRLLHRYFRERFEQLGGSVAVVQAYDQFDPAPLRSADAVYLASAPDGLGMIRRLRESGVDAPILGGDGLDDTAFWSANPDLDRTYFTTHAFVGIDSPDALAREFVAAFDAAYPAETADAFGALGYDAAGMVIDAVRRAGSDDPRRVLEALAATHGFRAVTGEISYDRGSRIPRKSVTIIEVSNGDYAPVTQRTPSRVPSP